MNGVKNSTKYLRLLSEILIGADDAGTEVGGGAAELAEIPELAASLTHQELGELWALAQSHHVIVRSFPKLQQLMESAGNYRSAEWAQRALEDERARITRALAFLEPICEALQNCGTTIVIKSLDHWPDLGSDLDLYTDAEATAVVSAMQKHFGAQPADRSWGDRLANKWNFVVPGLPELVEVHVGRLGQTGEQIAITQSLTGRARLVQRGERSFWVPAPEDRMIISTLQRMYRHFYIRLCDIIDNAALIESADVDYLHLRSVASDAGLWDGLATYLAIISGYVALFRGESLSLPGFVISASRFGCEQVYFRRNFIRVPMFPHSVALYASELKKLCLNGELRNALRLSLLPGLATAAVLEMKITGSDKGVW